MLAGMFKVALALLSLSWTSVVVAASPAPLRLELGGGAEALELVRVPAGSFRQGSPMREAGRAADELAHNTTVTHDFYIGVVPVLRGQFARFVAATNYRTESERGTSGGHGLVGGTLVQRRDFNWRSPGFAQTDQHPVVLVTFADAEEFARWASRVTGRMVRLPTEAEWELACRAGTETAYFGAFDEAGAHGLGWFKDGAGDGTRVVRGKRANELGLYDLIGQVQQWTADVYAPYDGSPAHDPLVKRPPAGEPLRQVLRGGSFLTQPSSGRSAARARATPGSRNADFGFRVVVDATEVATPSPPPTPAPTSTPAAAPATAPSAGPTPLPKHSSGGFGFLPFLFVAAVLLVVVVGSGKRRKKVAPGSGSAGALKSIRLQAAADGFRIFAPPETAGRQLRYRYTLDGKEGLVRLEPSPAGQFVYTGGPPSGLAALALVEAAAAVAVASAASDPLPSDSTFGSGSSSSGGGFPPAY